LIVNTESQGGVDLINSKLEKKSAALIILFLFLVISFFPAIQSLKLDNNYSEIGTENIDKIPIFKQIGPVGTYEQYINSREDKPFFIKLISERITRGDTPLVIIFIEDDIISEITDELTLYNETLKNVGYNTLLYQVSGIKRYQVSVFSFLSPPFPPSGPPCRNSPVPPSRWPSWPRKAGG